MLTVKPLRAFKDNYIWMIINPKLKAAIAVDPGDATPVFKFLAQSGLELTAILITHKHADHTGGVEELLRAYPELCIYAHSQEKLSTTTHAVIDGERISISGWDLAFQVIHIPGHTLGHVAYYSHPLLFTGDTLFGAGCGRVFEGTPAQMLNSLQLLAALPDDTLVYCGHEYTLANLAFALKVDPQNAKVEARVGITKSLVKANQPTLPSTIGLEKATNPFLRCNDPEVIAGVGSYAKAVLTNETEVFRLLREWKNVQ